jgi:hypothetical protein
MNDTARARGRDYAAAIDECKLAELAREVHDSFASGWIFKAHDWMRRYEEAIK